MQRVEFANNYYSRRRAPPAVNDNCACDYQCVWIEIERKLFRMLCIGKADH